MPHVHNALHHFARVQAGYRAALGEGDPAFTGIERAGETITPTLDLWSLPEWALPRGEVLFGRHISEGALAAQFSGLEIINPTGSNVLAVVKRVQFVTASSQLDLVIDSGGSIMLNPSTERGVALDGRFSTLGESSRVSLVHGDLNSGAVLPQAKLNGNAVDAPGPWILPPGTKLFVITAGENESFFVNLVWGERLASQDELAQFGA